ncbi:hypothetical protein F4805DRAFT_140939 [Annulohypoxylon moriforme]|nr:hypothetical protein F4805DRAFT_140939 [Annulohypoxylon moriforme]
MPSILRRLFRRAKFNREKERQEEPTDSVKKDTYPDTGDEGSDRTSLDNGLGALEFPNDCQGPGNGVDVVFVHGLRGSRIKTWSKGDKFWPRDFLKDDLKNARIITWGYDANIANAVSYASKESLFGHANTLLNDLARLRRGITRPIIFVCHSLGGLVVKEALITSDNYRNHDRHPARGDIYAKTTGVIFLGTPHQGSSKESYGEIVANIAHLSFRQPNKQLLQTLNPDSHILEKQRNDFTTISNDMSIICIREELPTGAGIIVPRDSALHCSFKAIHDSIHANHMDMARFSSRDQGYMKVLGYIEEIRDAISYTSQAILKMLQFRMIDSRREGIDDAYGDTCSWILDGPKDTETTTKSNQFLSWLKNDEPFFWVSGKAGCGKSTLMKYLYHDRRTETTLRSSPWIKSKDLILISHFFYDRGTDDQKSREGMLRSILYHILRTRRKLIPECFPILFQTKFYGAIKDSTDVLGWEDLKTAFISMLDHLEDSKICLFLDGLDEYRMVGEDKSYTEEELDLIFDGENEDEAWGRSSWITDGHKEIARFIHDLGASGIVKICLSSRELNIFEYEFQDFPRIKVHEHTFEPIIEYCQGNLVKAAPDLDNLPKFVSSITEKSRGVFLWVRIVVGMLIDGYTDGNSEDELWQILNALPRRLGGDDGLYMRMMRNVNRKYLSESKRLFQLVSDSSGLSLDIITLFLAEEWHLEDGKELRATTDKYQPRTWDEMQLRWKALEKRLKSRCGGLLEGTNEVQFMHQTAKEFISRAYLNKKIFQNAIGFPNPPQVTLAWMSGCIRRLKCCKEAIITPDKVIISPQLHGDSANPFDSIEISHLIPDILYSLFHIAYAWRKLGSDYCHLYVKLLDELNHTCDQLITSLDDLRHDLNFTWLDIYLEQGTSAQKNYHARQKPLRIMSLLELASLNGLFPYVEAKIKGKGVPKDQLDLLLLQISRRMLISWRGGGAGRSGPVVPEIFEILFQEGADPNCRETDPSLQFGLTPWTYHLMEGTQGPAGNWVKATEHFLRFGANPTVHMPFNHRVVRDSGESDDSEDGESNDGNDGIEKEEGGILSTEYAITQASKYLSSGYTKDFDRIFELLDHSKKRMIA